EDQLGPIMGRLLEDLLECHPDPIGSRCFEMHAGECIKGCALRNGEAPIVFEPEESTVLEFWPILALGTPDLVDGIVDELDGMKLVEGDLSFGEIVGDALYVCSAHVNAHFLDAGGIRVVVVDMISEPRNRLGVIAFGDVD